MKRMASITVRIPEEMKRQLYEFNIKVSEVTRNALEEELKQAKRKRAEEAGERVGQLLAGTTREEVVRLIRRGREER